MTNQVVVLIVVVVLILYLRDYVTIDSNSPTML